MSLTGTLSALGSTLTGAFSLTNGISGGIPYFTGGADIGSTGALIAGGVILGGGAGSGPSTTGTALQYNGQTLAGNGLTVVVGYTSTLASGASIGTANLVAAAPAGLYRITAYLATSTAGSGNVVTTIGWTDAVGAKTSATPATLTLTSGSFVTASILVQVAAGTAITYATAWTGTGAYNIYVVVERVQ